MICFNKAEVTGWDHAIRGMRNPMNSWDKSDSRWSDGYFESLDDKDSNSIVVCHDSDYDYNLGPHDAILMLNLRDAGTDHRKFMRMITVYVDITAPLYWWKEFDTYKVGTVANSCSTMHKITDKEFTRDDFSCEHLIGDGVVPDHDYQASTYVLDLLIKTLNFWRNEYITGIETGIKNNKQSWWQIIQLLPSSYNQKRTVMLNYEVLANMYKSRKDHKLDEWREFCKWVENLPFSELITK